MKKVILKAKINDRDEFEDRLDKVGLLFSPLFWQHDRIYVPRGYKPNANFPRLVMRTEMTAVDVPPEYTLLLRRHIEDSGVDAVEETRVTDYVEMVNIILQLGFKPLIEVSRRRETLTMNEKTVIHLDEIDNRQGEFYAKIEKTVENNESVEKVREELAEILRSFGETDLLNRPYAEL